MTRESGEMDRSTIPDSPGPDTEPSDPPSSEPDPTSVEVSVHMESSVQPKTPRTVSDPAKSLAATARSAGNSRGPLPQEPQNSSTTLQSMKKPDVKNSGVPHSRRFLSIENDLDQANATIRLLEKGLIGAQKEARIAWILATCALLVAAAAIAL